MVSQEPNACRMGLPLWLAVSTRATARAEGNLLVQFGAKEARCSEKATAHCPKGNLSNIPPTAVTGNLCNRCDGGSNVDLLASLDQRPKVLMRSDGTPRAWGCCGGSASILKLCPQLIPWITSRAQDAMDFGGAKFAATKIFHLWKGTVVQGNLDAHTSSCQWPHGDRSQSYPSQNRSDNLNGMGKFLNTSSGS